MNGNNLTSTGTQLATHLSNYIVPIFQDLAPNRPAVIGTALLTEHLGAPYLVTAAHVVTRYSNAGAMYFYTDGQTRRQIFGEWLTNPRGGPSEQSSIGLDVAIIRLLNYYEPSLKLDGKNCLPSSSLIDTQVDEGFNRESNWFLLTGFPTSKTKPKLHRQEVESEMWTLLTHEAPLEAYKEEGVNPALFLLLKLSDKSLQRNGVRVTVPDLNGASGSPIWLIGSAEQDVQSSDNCVAGIATDHLKPSRGIVAVRVGAVQHLFRMATQLTLSQSYEFVL